MCNQINRIESWAMANHSTNLNWNSPDYFKLFDDIGGSNGISGGTPLNANNVANANNANFGSFDFYGNSLANGIGSTNNGTTVDSVSSAASATAATLSTVSSPSSGTMINQTFQYQYQYDYGTEPHNNKSNYDGGSNFMLLMEDFSAYFYNYNGSVGSGIGTTGSTINANGSIGFELQNNCSIANSTCNDNSGKEKHTHRYRFYIRPILQSLNTSNKIKFISSSLSLFHFGRFSFHVPFQFHIHFHRLHSCTRV